METTHTDSLNMKRRGLLKLAAGGVLAPLARVVGVEGRHPLEMIRPFCSLFEIGWRLPMTRVLQMQGAWLAVDGKIAVRALNPGMKAESGEPFSAEQRSLSRIFDAVARMPWKACGEVFTLDPWEMVAEDVPCSACDGEGAPHCFDEECDGTMPAKVAGVMDWMPEDQCIYDMLLLQKMRRNLPGLKFHRQSTEEAAVWEKYINDKVPGYTVFRPLYFSWAYGDGLLMPMRRRESVQEVKEWRFVPLRRAEGITI